MTIGFSIKSSFVSKVSLWIAIIISQKHIEELIICMLGNRRATDREKIDSYVYLLHRHGYQNHSTILKKEKEENSHGPFQGIVLKHS
jgi:hypothetical protein